MHVQSICVITYFIAKLIRSVDEFHGETNFASNEMYFHMSNVPENDTETDDFGNEELIVTVSLFYRATPC